MDNMFKELSDEAKARFREWARNNHKAGGDINCTWHPIIKDECRLIDEEFVDNKVAKVIKVDFTKDKKNNEN